MPQIRVIPLETKATSDLGGHSSQPEHAAIEVIKRDNLLAALLANGVKIGNDCGGNAQCATCRVRVESADFVLPSMTMAESYALSRARKSGIVRLACQLRVEGEMCVEVLDHGEDHDESESE